jgi:hypothetical protein
MNKSQSRDRKAIAQFLNGRDAKGGDAITPEWAEAWLEAAAMLAPSPKGKFSVRQVDWFNDLAERAQVKFALYRNKNGTVEPFWALAKDYVRGRVVKLLWDNYFTNQGWRYFKRCEKCRAWFVDESRNGVKRFCSRPCADLWWTRDRRKKAGAKTRRKKK